MTTAFPLPPVPVIFSFRFPLCILDDRQGGLITRPGHLVHVAGEPANERLVGFDLLFIGGMTAWKLGPG